MEKKENLDWKGLERYTSDFKNWSSKLFGKAHARMGHIEEELAEAKDTIGDYCLKLDISIQSGKIKYVLYDKNSETEHGAIEIDSSTGIAISTWEECI